MFSLSIARDLMQLQTLSVTECCKMEVLISSEEEGDQNEIASTTTETTDKIVFPKLKELNLEDLPSFTAICKAINGIELPQLNRLDLWWIPKLNSFCNTLDSNYDTIQPLFNKFSLSTNGRLDVTGIDEPTEIWHNQLEVGCLDKVGFMRVQCCGKLSSVVSSKLMQRLHNIQGLKVWWCDSLEMIFDLQEGGCADVAEKETLITQLSELLLKYLPKLTHIWKNISQRTHCFKNLSSLKVQHCDNLRYIFTISMANVLVNLDDLTVEHCEKVEKIVTRENGEEIFSLEIFTVNLKNLPSLVCFGPDLNDTEIPAEETTVYHCPKFPGNDDDFHWEELGIRYHFDIDVDKLCEHEDEYDRL
ncbi:hypothetical protein CsSME_00038408 [Camellia sinensis var. sinensis]